MIHRESEWDDETRARAIALAEYEAGMCGCGCGRPAAESHRKGAYGVSTVRCYAGQALAVVRRRDQEKHKDDPDLGPDKPHWDDGLHYYAEPADMPDEDDN